MLHGHPARIFRRVALHAVEGRGYADLVGEADANKDYPTLRLFKEHEIRGFDQGKLTLPTGDGVLTLFLNSKWQVDLRTSILTCLCLSS